MSGNITIQIHGIINEGDGPYETAFKISQAILIHGAGEIEENGLNECVIAQDSEYTLTVQKRVK